MMMRPFIRLVFAVMVSAAGVGWTDDLQAGETVEVEAKLIWATNDSQPPNESYKRAEADLSKDLQRAFKWKNYFVINKSKTELAKNKSANVKMSEHCRLKLKYLGDDMFEVWIWGKDPKSGEETAVAKGKQKMSPNQKILLMGVTENESGWVVKLSRP